VLETCFSRGFKLDAVMVALDLTEAYVASGEYASAARLVGEIHPVLRDWGLHRNALAAWLLLEAALEAGASTTSSGGCACISAGPGTGPRSFRDRPHRGPSTYGPIETAWPLRLR
jgi:hypothetical protein